jgi:hypothetical protein
MTNKANKTRQVQEKSNDANALTKPALTLVPEPVVVPSLDEVTENKASFDSAVTKFAMMLTDYNNSGLSRRQQLQDIIEHTLYFNFRHHKVQMIQKLLGVLAKDTDTAKVTLERVICYYQTIGGFKIHRVGNDFQIKRLNTPEFTYDAEHMKVCKLSGNSFWHLSKGEAEKPYKAKELDTIKKSIATQLATTLMLEEASWDDIESLIKSLKASIVSASQDPKIIAKVEKTKVQKYAEPETYQHD